MCAPANCWLLPSLFTWGCGMRFLHKLTPHCSILPTQVREGAPRSIASALCTLGYILHFLLTGCLHPDSGAPLQEGGDSSSAKRISVDAALAIAGLTKADPAQRLDPSEFLKTAWLSSSQVHINQSDKRASSTLEKVLPQGSHEGLNAWLDTFTYESLRSKLELMRED